MPRQPKGGHDAGAANKKCLWLMLTLVLLSGRASGVHEDESSSADSYASAIPVSHNSSFSSSSSSSSAERSLAAVDSQLSASERNRRLIPYMTFYLPPTELPINQQYAVHQPQRIKTPLSLPSSVEGSAGPLPPPPQGTGHHYLRGPPSPSTYGHRHSPSGPEGSGALEPIDYHSTAYGASDGGVGGQYPLPSGPQQQQQQQPNAAPILHLLPPGMPKTASLSTGGRFRQKFKTVQHFPPTQAPVVVPHQSRYQSPQQYHLKQSKLHINPFTSSNTLPGHFTPIIYSPLSSGNGDGNDGSDQGNRIATNGGGNGGGHGEGRSEEDDSHLKYHHQHQHHHQHHHQHRPQQKQQRQPQPPQQQQQEVAFIEYPHAASNDNGGRGSVTPSPIYHVVNTAPPASSLSYSSQPPSASAQSKGNDDDHDHDHDHRHHHHQHHHPTQHITSPLALKQQQSPSLSSGHSQPQSQHFGSMKVENFFTASDTEATAADGAGNTQQHMTPQEKYVQYLQQRIRYNKQQQQQQQRERLKEPQEQLYYTNNQKAKQSPGPAPAPQLELQPHIYLISQPSTAAPAPSPTLQQPQSHYSHYQHHPAQTFTIDSPSSSLEGGGGGGGGGHHPHHSPIRHAVYARPELAVPANHQPAQPSPRPSYAKPFQQVALLPIPDLITELDAMLSEQAAAAGNGNGGNSSDGKVKRVKSPALVYHPKAISPSPPHYVDFIASAEDPKQSLDDDHHHHPQPLGGYHHTNRQQNYPQSPLKPTIPPPQTAFILVTTGAPPVRLSAPTPSPVQQHPHRYRYYSTERPLYKQKPTLRLKALTTPLYISPTPAPAPTPTPTPSTSGYYHSPRPTPTHIYHTTPVPTTTSIKLNPSYKYQTSSTAAADPREESVKIATPYDTNGYPPPRNSPHPYNKHHPLADPNQLPDIRTSSLAEILHKLQASNHLPQTLTPDNIDNSIKTLITILNNLKQTQTIDANPQQHHDSSDGQAATGETNENDYEYPKTNNGAPPSGTNSEEDLSHGNPPQDLSVISPPAKVVANKYPGPSTGRPGIDYPNYAEIPQTSFECHQQRYKGFFGDPETNCQVWHYCDLNGGKASFLCPNGTIFSQIALTCDWWFNVKCSSTPQLYVLNERLYKYILPFTPKFPEDYSGPLVDKYLAMKFQEMEEKMRLEKQKAAKIAAEVEKAMNHLEEATTPEMVMPNKFASSSTINSHVSEQSSERNLLIDDEVDDLAERASIDTYESSTTATVKASTTKDPSEGQVPTAATPPAKQQAEEPLSLRPIVVSSTTEPDYDQNSAQVDLENNHGKAPYAERYKQSPPNDSDGKKQPHQRESTKISVEKVEVIEIKNDGSSGHLLPEMLLNDSRGTSDET